MEAERVLHLALRLVQSLRNAAPPEEVYSLASSLLEAIPYGLDDPDISDTWKALEKIVRRGYARDLWVQALASPAPTPPEA